MAKKKAKKTRAAAASQQAVVAVSKPSIVMEWEKYMGHGELEDWQRLMRDLGFEEDFPSKTKCRKVLKTVWVNIPDFLQAIKQGHPVHHFESQLELADYTKQHRRFYPRNSIEKQSPLKQLLAHIFNNRGGKGHGKSALAVQMGGLSLV
ncbi:hypothetical protein F4859DRAFT_367354 [Xylaria cf. heliscus]|nr:hypothetical protein F4859DRAFT_367354 [Xylaria cf. heliscus]